MPALYSLAYRHLLPERFAIVGAARSEETDDEFRERMKEAVKAHARDPFDKEVWDKLAAGMHYATLEFADESDEDDLGRHLREHRRASIGTNGNRVYYFAVPPSAIGTLVTRDRRSAAPVRAGCG